jgi:Holliday junction resolvase RusA-like endonuclease
MKDGYILDYTRPVVEVLEASENIIILKINGSPVPWKAPRVCRFGTYAPHGEIKKYLRRKIGILYNKSLLKEAVTCDLKFYLPVPKTSERMFKKARDAGREIYHTKKPDRINLGKFAEDILEGSILKNDSQIIGGNVHKEYSTGKPYTTIALTIHH